MFELEKNKITDMEKQILLGSLLGDMSAVKECQNTRVEETHSLVQLDYLKWKHKNMPSINSKIITIKSKTKNKDYPRLLSKTSNALNWFYDQFYSSGKKRVTENILCACQETALAVWYCDDGSYDFENRQCSFHTESFSEEENQLIKEFLYDHFGLKGSLKKVRGYFCLRLNVDSTDRFLNLVRDTILSMPNSMHYKLGNLVPENDEKIREFKLKKKLRAKAYQQKESVRVKRNKLARERYKETRHKILKKISSKVYKLKRKKYMQEYLKRPEAIKRIREYRKEYRKTEKYRRKAREYQREYRRKKREKGDKN